MKTKDNMLRQDLSRYIDTKDLRKYWADNQDQVRKDWYEIRDKVLYKSLWFKYNSPKNTPHTNDLLATYPNPILYLHDISDNSTLLDDLDSWHGIDVNLYKGNNMLGKIHMNIRHKLNNQVPF